MKVRIKGIEAVAAGLTRAGIKRAVLAVGEWNPRLVDLMTTNLNIDGLITESVSNAHDAIGTGFYYAQNCVKTVSFIGENKLFYIAEIMNDIQKANAAHVIVVMEEQENYRFTEILYTYGVHFWTASDPGSIYKIMYDAVEYSEAYGKPAVIWYPLRFLVSDAVVDHKKLAYKDNLAFTGMKEKTRHIHKIQSRYNRMIRTGKHVIAVPGEVAGIVCRMTDGIEDIAVVSIDMYYPELQLPSGYESIMLIEKCEMSTGTELYKQADMKVVITPDFYRWEEILFHSLADYLKGKQPTEYFKGKAWQRNYDEMLKIRRPDTEGES